MKKREWTPSRRVQSQTTDTMDPSTTQLTEAEKQNIQSHEQSMRAPLTVEGETEKKDGIVKGSDTSTDEKVASAPQDPGDRPTGLKLAFILTALILSVFLFSLDQVGYDCTKFSCNPVVSSTL
jgi:hypothetical protein